MANGPQKGSEQDWWSSRGGEVYGPYDHQTVLFCRRDGRIVDDDYVKQGEGPWLRAGEVLPARAPSESAPPGPAAQPATPLATTPRQPAKRSSNTLVIAVVIAGVAFVLLAALAIVAAILFPVFSQANKPSQATTCLSNVRQLGVALMMYAEDHEETLPEADSWEEAVAPYIRDAKILACPVTGKHYVFNEALSGVDLKDLDNPQETPMLWEPAVDAQGLVGPHMGQFTVGYVDGHVTVVDTLPGAN